VAEEGEADHGRRLCSGSLTTEDVRSHRSGCSHHHRRCPWREGWTTARELPELERFIRMSCCSGDLTPVDALDLFDELLQRARLGSVIALNQLLTVVTRAPASSSVSDSPTIVVSLFNRMAQAGAKKVTPDLYTYSVILGCSCRMGRAWTMASPPSVESSRWVGW
jgi:hypothetical protein